MRALLSVHDKTGLVSLARGLSALGWELLSTGGTFNLLEAEGISVRSVDSVTGFPEMLDGRVKTLHPRIHGGLLARQELPEHREQLRRHDIQPIGLLVSNLYPFAQAVQDRSLGDDAKIEQIDIGGPAMVRAAAKNHQSVIVVTSPLDYDDILTRLGNDTVTTEHRRALAAKAFGHVAAYDALVAEFLRGDVGALPEELSIGLTRVEVLKYGENPHQRAAVYRRPLASSRKVSGMLDAEQLAGPGMSFNNYLDADAAWNAIQGFAEPAAAVVKHMVPCGLATRATLGEAIQTAFEGDPVSAFGGIVAVNRLVDAESAAILRSIKLDIVIGPDFDPDAVVTIARRKATRILKLPTYSRASSSARPGHLDVRIISGGMLVQTPDVEDDDRETWRVVTDRQPTAAEMETLEFAWRVARQVKSNAIVIAADCAVVGVGAGQPNRLESVNIAVRKAGDRARGAALASDAFFPFPDGLERGATAGVAAVIQPGGSVNDQLVIDAANDAGLCMILTGTRHFRH